MSEYDVDIGCDLLLVAIRKVCSALIAILAGETFSRGGGGLED